MIPQNTPKAKFSSIQIFTGEVTQAVNLHWRMQLSNGMVKKPICIYMWISNTKLYNYFFYRTILHTQQVQAKTRNPRM